MDGATGCNDELKIITLGRWEPLCAGGFVAVFYVSNSTKLSTLAVCYYNNDKNCFFMCCLNPGMGRT